MAVTLISNPVGHKLSTTEIDALIYDNAGDAVVYVPGGHTLSDGDYIFIESNFDAYNGFKYVDSIAYDQFKIKESEKGDYVQFKQEANIIFYVSELQHGFQCVHLPIVYELKSDLWPINVAEEEYTPNVIDSFEDYNGYVQLNLDRALDNPLALEYINLIAPSETDEIQGPYQIIQVLHDWAIVINLAYDSTFDFSNYQIQKYYNNYFITVNVYGGLQSGHRWYSDKPFELLATLKFIPDSDGKIKFSISEILKGQIITRNNLTLDTLPNNLDFYTQFYISYSESYDISDGTDISVHTESLTTDNFIGHALNAILPFKSLNQGHLSDYIASDTQLSRWLTTQDRPIGLVGYFFDLSFINQFHGVDILVTIYKSLNDVVTETELIEISNPGQGIIRVPINIESGFDQYCIQAKQNGYPESYEDIDLPHTNLWDSAAGDSVRTIGYNFIAGRTYTITLHLQKDESGVATNNLLIRNSSNNDVIFSSSADSPMGGGTFDLSITFVATEDCNSISWNRGVFLPGEEERTFCLSVEANILIPAILESNITEQICIDIVDDCNTFINDDLRLTEGGQFRELE